ncbi:TIGR03546 family protein [Pleionea sediminis]|uniref:TIGR03546 family protein n=1 Tax=Pleionea sediminis TaxID=2569479 RepID=UPI00118615C8|nr:TIGR03546 family protein [Pleionea sediminis]
MLNLIAKFLKVLNSEESPSAVGWAIALAFIFAMLPLFSAAKWVILLLVAFLRVNLSMFILFSILFPLLAWLLDPLFNAIGLWLLQNPQLETFWTTVTTSSVGQSLALNNTLALSSLIVGVVLLIPLYWGSKKLVVLYRNYLKERVEKLYLVRMLKATKLYQIYQSMA